MGLPTNMLESRSVNNQLTPGAIAGTAMGAVAVVMTFVCLVLFCLRKKRKKGGSGDYLPGLLCGKDRKVQTQGGEYSLSISESIS